MTGICYFVREKKIEENICKCILNKMDLGRYPTILDQFKFTDMSKHIRDSELNLLLQKLVIVLFFCSCFCWLIKM